MEQEKLLNELIENRTANIEKLRELLEIHDLAVLGYKMQSEREKEITNRVLAEHEFFASEECKRLGISKGGRITSENDTFLLSDEDFQRLLDLEAPILVAENVTDERGFYVVDWASKMTKAWQELVNFIIQKIVPASMRETFWENRLSIVKMDKLIESVRKIA